MATLDDRVTICDDVVFRVLGEESVILSLDSGVYFGLDAIGTRMWTLLNEHDLRGVAAAVHEEFDAPLDQIEQDVVAIVEQLIAKKLVRPAGVTSP